MTSNTTQNSVNIEICDFFDKDCLKFVFIGNFTEIIAKQTCEEWKMILGDVKNGKIDMIWECTEMTGYDTQARIIWQQLLKEYKSKIGTIWVITNSTLIKAGLKLLSTFTSYHFKVLKTIDEINKNL
jgi:hypothetical protein